MFILVFIGLVLVRWWTFGVARKRTNLSSATDLKGYMGRIIAMMSWRVALVSFIGAVILEDPGFCGFFFFWFAQIVFSAGKAVRKRKKEIGMLRPVLQDQQVSDSESKDLLVARMLDGSLKKPQLAAITPYPPMIPPEPKYFIYTGRSVSGPFLKNELITLSSRREIDDETPCCLEGTETWTTYAQIKPSVSDGGQARKSAGRASPSKPASTSVFQFLRIAALLAIAIPICLIAVVQGNALLKGNGSSRKRGPIEPAQSSSPQTAEPLVAAQNVKVPERVAKSIAEWNRLYPEAKADKELINSMIAIVDEMGRFYQTLSFNPDAIVHNSEERSILVRRLLAMREGAERVILVQERHRNEMRRLFARTRHSKELQEANGEKGTALIITWMNSAIKAADAGLILLDQYTEGTPSEVEIQRFVDAWDAKVEAHSNANRTIIRNQKKFDAGQ